MKSQPSHARGARVAIALLLAGAMHCANAAYPEKPVRWLIPGAPGGAADSIARIVGTALAQRLGQPILIDNRPGAAGVIANDAVAKSAPDGYTFGLAGLSTFVVPNLLAKKLPYRPDQDFTPIGMICVQPNLLAVTTSLPVKSVKELIGYAKAHPGELFYGSSGNGSALHVTTELFRVNTGLQISHVPYKSTPAAEMDLAAGQIHMMIGNLTSMKPHVDSGRIRPLALTGPTRSALLPDVPTMAEAGVPAAQMQAWAGLVGPGKLPPAVLDKVHAELAATLADPKVKKQLNDAGCDTAVYTPASFAELFRSESRKWEGVIKKSNITVD